MSYTKQTWTSGDVITAAKMNHIEDGIGTGLPEVTSSNNGDVLTVVSGEWAAAAPVSDLPEVTSSNNGQVLKVVDGEWAVGEVGGNVVILYPADTAPAPPSIPLPEGYVWEAGLDNGYVSLEADGETATYDEFSEVVDLYERGAIVLTAFPNTGGTLPGTGSLIYTSITSGYKYESVENKKLYCALTLASGAAIIYEYNGESQ